MLILFLRPIFARYFSIRRPLLRALIPTSVRRSSFQRDIMSAEKAEDASRLLSKCSLDAPVPRATSEPKCDLASNKSGKGDVAAADLEESVRTVQVAVEDNASKFQIILGLLKKMVGVKDIVGMRISLPAQLLDPISNLEYWNYLDRPEYFSVISDPDDPLERMAAVVRWYLSKDLKFVKDKVVKAYNSILGEQFLAEFNTQAAPPPFSGTPVDKSIGPVRKVTMTVEQISHHPPISAFCYECPGKGIVARGLDQIAAKFTGTAVRITPGEENRGIFVVLSQRDGEEYACTHPTAYLNGWLRCSLYISVSEYAVITCEKTGLQAVLEYQDDKWFSKAKHAIEGRIFKLKGAPPPPSLTQLGKSHSKSSLTKAKHRQSDSRKTLSVASMDYNQRWTQHPGGVDMKAAYSPEREGETLARISGSWKGAVTIQRGSMKPAPLLDLQNMDCVPKEVRPISEQNPKESRRIWQGVSEAIRDKEFSKATALKHALEEDERRKAHMRKETSEPFVPEIFLPEDLWGRAGVPVTRRELAERRPYLPKITIVGHAETLGETKFVISPTGAVETSGEA